MLGTPFKYKAQVQYGRAFVKKAPLILSLSFLLISENPGPGMYQRVLVPVFTRRRFPGLTFVGDEIIKCRLVPLGKSR